MFTKINEGEIESTEGYRVSISHNHVTYRERDKLLLIDAEHCPDPYKLVIYTSTISKWKFPLDSVLVPKEKQKIKGRIMEAISFLGVPYELE